MGELLNKLTPNPPPDAEALNKLLSNYRSNLQVFLNYFRVARNLGIVTVVPAGNFGLRLHPEGHPLVVVAQGDMLPTNLGNRNSDLIIVGAANPDGTLASFSSPIGIHVNGALIQDENDPRLAAVNNPNLGWIDVYAPGIRVPTCSARNDGSIIEKDGTSVSGALMVSDPCSPLLPLFCRMCAC